MAIHSGNRCVLTPQYLMLVSVMMLCWYAMQPATVSALDPNKLLTQYRHQNWQAEDGLASNIIMAIRQTRDGYLWMATFSGLVRFDGKRFTVFNTANTAQLKNNSIWALSEDTKGALWVGTNGGGVIRYTHETFTTFGTEAGLVSNTVRALVCDNQGNVWIGTSKGLNTYRPAMNRMTTYNFEPSLGVPNTVNIASMLADSRGNLWVGSEGRGIIVITPQGSLCLTTRNGLPNDIITELYEDREHRIWVGTTSGLVVFAAHEKPSPSLQATRPAKGLDGSSIRCVRQDRDGIVWVASVTGFYRLNVAQNLYETLPNNELWNSYTNSICEDREGNLWFGNLGLNCLKDTKFTTYSVAEGLAGYMVYGSVQDRTDGSIWVAAYGGVSHGRLEQGSVSRYYWKNYMPGGSDIHAASNLVRGITQDRFGTLWVPTYGAGILRFDKSANKFVPTYSTKNGLSNDVIRNIFFDSRDRLWVASRNGLTKIEQGKCTVFSTDDGLPHSSMMCVHETSDHVIWIATDGGGVSRFDGASFTNFSTKHGLAADVVFFFYQDLRGNLWVGTNAGLSRWNPRKQRFTSLKAADGLYSENVFQMAEDNQGDVWFGSAAGIFRIRATALDSALAAKDAEQPFRLVCMAYNKMDGMQTVDCNVPVISPKDRDGNVWIMTKKGVVLVNPRTIKTNTQAPPVLVQSLTVDGTTLLAAQASASRMTIPPGKEQFVFDYTALSFTASERVHFRYKLENFDADWLDAQERRTAYYTKLPSGTYTFRVIACNNDGVWNTNGASLTFIVQPHLWQTTWFAALCLVAAGASAWGVFRWQVRRMRLRNMLLERTVGERTAALQHANNELGLVNQEVQRQNKLLSQQAVDIQIANTTLYEKNAQLEALNTEKNEFLGIVAHDLKNPLAKITMAASILQLYWQKMQQSEIQQRLQAIEETALSMAQTVTNLLD